MATQIQLTFPPVIINSRFCFFIFRHLTIKSDESYDFFLIKPLKNREFETLQDHPNKSPLSDSVNEHKLRICEINLSLFSDLKVIFTQNDFKMKWVHRKLTTPYYKKKY